MSSPRLQGLSLEGVTVSFGGAPALDGVTLRVEPGERVAIVGASGAGKSTLFRALTRGVALREGRVLVGGRDLYALNRRELRAARRRIGAVRQAYDLVPQLPVGVNAALGEVGGMGILGTLRTLVSGPGPDLSARVGKALERLGIGGMAGSRTADLSGGQQQRVAVARLLVQRPDLVLADEPFAAVDPVTTERVMGALLDLNREGATLLVNLHDVGIARRLPRMVALREGRVVFDGPPEGLTDERLSEVYAGDPRDATRDAPASAPAGDGSGKARRGGEGSSVRVAEGRGGVSAH